MLVKPAHIIQQLTEDLVAPCESFSSITTNFPFDQLLTGLSGHQPQTSLDATEVPGEKITKVGLDGERRFLRRVRRFLASSIGSGLGAPTGQKGLVSRLDLQMPAGVLPNFQCSPLKASKTPWFSNRAIM
jgi:hypothetical protein